jgi:hypothetical protein
MFDKLRDEIVASQKARHEFMKWKLILVAAIGAAGLGLSHFDQDWKGKGILLALIPFVSIYVDAVCFHNDLRIMAIARFLRTQTGDPEMKKYEDYCLRNRSSFSLEDFALVGTTLPLSLFILILGLSENIRKQLCINLGCAMTGAVWVWSGGIGAVAGLVFFGIYRYLKKYKFDRR